MRHFEYHGTLSLCALFVLGMGAGGCSEPNAGLSVCEASGLVCPPNWKCTDDGTSCMPDGCGDGVTDEDNGEVCDSGFFHGDERCRFDCLHTFVCGNGVVDPGEICDPTAIADPSAESCTSDCRSNLKCGDRFVNDDEQCDDGMMSASCDADCTFPFCGDGVRNMFAKNPATGVEEQCDMGGMDEECDADCTWVQCGDGVANTAAGEECDDGENDDSTDACLPGCKSAWCGDGFVHEDVEACDKGGDHVECDGDCTPPLCGDGYLNEEAGEVCDDGNTLEFDDCPSGPSSDGDSRARCKPASCGDGFVQIGVEECDDGNNDDSDRCPSGERGSCQLAFCGDGIESVGETCDDGDNDNSDDCPDGVGGTCQDARCGDGHRRHNQEECDDGNEFNGDACPDGPGGSCELARCGDDFIHLGVEECEAGVGDDTTATCDPDCTRPQCGDGLKNEDAGEECDDGNRSNQDECVEVAGECRDARCGDNFLFIGVEACDDGQDTEDCNGPDAPSSAECQRPRCGDGYINREFGEACEKNSDCDGVDGFCNPVGDPDECTCA